MRGGAASEVFTAFLKLELTSFGGPIAHLAYFRREFVERRELWGQYIYLAEQLTRVELRHEAEKK